MNAAAKRSADGEQKNNTEFRFEIDSVLSQFVAINIFMGYVQCHIRIFKNGVAGLGTNFHSTQFKALLNMLETGHGSFTGVKIERIGNTTIVKREERNTFARMSDQALARLIEW